MKILDIPQSGKRGLYVSQGGRYGQISRALVIPSNPRTVAQTSVRGILSRVAAAWRGLQESQRAAWTAAASGVNSASRLGQSGPLTGLQLFNKINCTLAQFGQEQVVAPPARPQFPALAPQSLVITNASGVVALKLTCPTSSGREHHRPRVEAAEPGLREMHGLPDHSARALPPCKARPTSRACTRPGMVRPPRT